MIAGVGLPLRGRAGCPAVSVPCFRPAGGYGLAGGSARRKMEVTAPPYPPLSNLPVHDADVHDLGLLVKAHHPLVFVDGYDQGAITSLLGAVAREQNLPLYVWTAHDGLVRQGGPGDGAVYKTDKPAACLAHLRSADQEALFLLSGFESYLTEPDIQSRIIELHDRFMRHRGAIVLAGDPTKLPAALSGLFTVLHPRTPTREAYHAFVSEVLGDVRQRMPVTIDLTPRDVSELIEHLYGLPFHEVRKIITQAVVQDGRLDQSDLSSVLDAKRRIIERLGTLEFIPVVAGSTQLAGLSKLKSWLEKRRMAFVEPARARSLGLPPPRGLLLTGVQGCGKSLAARAVSAAFGLPLLRMDPGSLYRKYFGESEANMRTALRTAERVAPCILWIDEIEKAFGRGDSDGGTAHRILGTFLTWLQEKRGTVFVMATANDISDLPPELLRKGRFDEIFFVDLPSHEVREHIFALHLAARRLDPSTFDIPALASAALGFSGAEIEQAVVSGLYSGLALDRPLDTELLLHELKGTQPLSVTMAEKVEALRTWARERAVFVD